MRMQCPTAARAEPAAGKPAGLSRRRRITLSAHFSEAFEQDRCFKGRLLIMWLRSAPDAGLRVGVVVTKKVGNSPVRARAKRLMREAYRLNRHRFSGLFDVVLLARHGILRARRQDVESDLMSVARRAGILRDSG